MDRFFDLIDRLSELGKRDLEEWREDAMLLCACKDCPSYIECSMHSKEGLYCIDGRDECNDQLPLPDACRCVDCPLALQNDMERLFYCFKGAELEIREGH